MKKKLFIGAGLSVAGLTAFRRFGPSLHQRAMDKCQEMFNRMSQRLPANHMTGHSTDASTSIPCDPTGCAPVAAEEPRPLAAAA